MKNKKLLYLLTTIITIFSFNLNANAAQELTCVYEWSNELENYGKIILIQNSNNEHEIYINSNDVEIDGFGWESMNYNRIIFDWDNLKREFEGGKAYLSSCPDRGRISGADIYFYGDGDNWSKLESNGEYKSIKKIGGVDVVKPQNSNTTESLYDLDNSKYTGSCKYKRMLENELGDGYTHYVQINIGEKNILFTEYDPKKGTYSGVTIETSDTRYAFSVDKGFTLPYYMNKYGGDCPDTIMVKRVDTPIVYNEYGTAIMEKAYIGTIILTEEANEDAANAYIIDSVSGINPITKKELTKEDKYGDDVIFSNINIENCKDLLGEEIYGYLNIIWNLVKIGIPIILIGLGVVDFTQAVFAGKEDNMKKAQSKFIKRVIIAVIIFLIPTVLGFLLKLANGVWGNIGTDICGIIF